MAERESETATKIVFAGGGEVTVDQEAAEVVAKLQRGERLTELKTARGDVHVAVDQVAYVEAVEPRSSRRERWRRESAM
jgi:hypothetical protein